MLKTVIIIGVIGGVGYWAYNKYAKDKIEKTNSILNFFHLA